MRAGGWFGWLLPDSSEGSVLRIATDMCVCVCACVVCVCVSCVCACECVCVCASCVCRVCVVCVCMCVCARVCVCVVCAYVCVCRVCVCVCVCVCVYTCVYLVYAAVRVSGGTNRNLCSPTSRDSVGVKAEAKQAQLWEEQQNNTGCRKMAGWSLPCPAMPRDEGGKETKRKESDRPRCAPVLNGKNFFFPDRT